MRVFISITREPEVMPFRNQEAIPIRENIEVSELVEKLKQRIKIELLPVAATEYASKKLITEADLHRPGLALAGYVDLFTFQRIQVIGNTECNFLNNLDEQSRLDAFSKLLSFNIPVIFLTDNNELDDALLKKADASKIPVYRTELETTKFMFLLRDFLEDY